MSEEKVYYILFYKGNFFQTLLAVSKYINKEGPYGTQREAIEKSMQFRRPCIVYNAEKQSYLYDQRQSGFPADAIQNLMAWGKKHIPCIKRTRSYSDGDSEQTPLLSARTLAERLLAKRLLEEHTIVDEKKKEYIFEPINALPHAPAPATHVPATHVPAIPTVLAPIARYT